MLALASEFLKIMLGWVQNVAYTVYAAIATGRVTGVLGFVSHHWVTLLIVFSVLGVVIDFLVYLAPLFGMEKLLSASALWENKTCIFSTTNAGITAGTSCALCASGR